MAREGREDLGDPAGGTADRRTVRRLVWLRHRFRHGRRHRLHRDARWGEAIGLPRDCLRDDVLGLEWKLYELGGRFYRGRPKDGSIRAVDLPPFLAELLAGHLAAGGKRTCTCRNTTDPWCRGGKYAFLGPNGGHFRRSARSSRFFRPAADGWHPANSQRPAAPVLVDMAGFFPGRPVPPWPAALAGQPFQPPAGKGVARLVSDASTGRCSQCGRAQPRRRDGRLITHHTGGGQCEGSGQASGEDALLASWLPVLPRLTPHGLRHGHQTWMEERGISDLLRSERMGHEVPGMRGIYGHVSPAMRAGLKAGLQERWDASLRDRTRLCPRSAVPVLDALLTVHGLAWPRSAPSWPPKSDISRGARAGGVSPGPLIWRNLVGDTGIEPVTSSV